MPEFSCLLLLFRRLVNLSDKFIFWSVILEILQKKQVSFFGCLIIVSLALQQSLIERLVTNDGFPFCTHLLQITLTDQSLSFARKNPSINYYIITSREQCTLGFRTVRVFRVSTSQQQLHATWTIEQFMTWKRLKVRDFQKTTRMRWGRVCHVLSLACPRGRRLRSTKLPNFFIPEMTCV